LLIKSFTSRFFKTNTYLVACDLTKKAAIIDPGRNLVDLTSEVRDRGLEVIAIINTHTHGDHVLGNHKAKELFAAPIFVHETEKDRLPRIGPSAFILGKLRLSPPADQLLNDGDIIEVGSLRFEVIHTPGHTKGSICIRYKKAIFTGDTLFRGTIGMADVKSGAHDRLVESIKERLFILSDDIRCYPGHGKRTTIGDERRYNLFVRLTPEQLEQLLMGPPPRPKDESKESNS
jgi:hydroxyacylglutathione hydrolase